jgi:hypothetical protein
VTWKASYPGGEERHLAASALTLQNDQSHACRQHEKQARDDEPELTVLGRGWCLTCAHHDPADHERRKGSPSVVRARHLPRVRPVSVENGAYTRLGSTRPGVTKQAEGDPEHEPRADQALEPIPSLAMRDVASNKEAEAEENREPDANDSSSTPTGRLLGHGRTVVPGKG